MSSEESDFGFGNEINILRQRFFIDHTSKLKKQHLEEFTLSCRTDNELGVSNIFLKIPKLLPNLKIYDNDGTELAIVTNKYTKALIRSMIKNPQHKTVKDKLEKLDKDTSSLERKYWLLWIKLPDSRRFKNDEVRVITLEYGATEDENFDGKNHVLEFHSKSHEVFYVVTPPADYEIDKDEVAIINEKGTILKKIEKSWKNEKDDPFYRDKYQDSISYRVKPEIKDQIEYTYSFKPIRSIIDIPRVSWSLLIVASGLLFLAKIFHLNHQYCLNQSFCIGLDHVVDKDVEIGVGIIGASLIIASLIQNQDIRHSFRYVFLASIVLSILAIVIKI